MATKDSTSMRPVRDKARVEAELGVAYLARAFNYTKNPDLPYVWSTQVLERFEELIKEIVYLVETGDVAPREGAFAQDDLEFQKFIGALIR
jgi:hypothetical protein